MQQTRLSPPHRHPLLPPAPRRLQAWQRLRVTAAGGGFEPTRAENMEKLQCPLIVMRCCIACAL
jgi:hypothetical protein